MTLSGLFQRKACLVRASCESNVCRGSGAGAVPEIALSLCGTLDHQDARISGEAFNRYLITHEALCENPALLSDPSLVVRVGSKCVELRFSIEDFAVCLVVCNVGVLKMSEQLTCVVLSAAVLSL